MANADFFKSLTNLADARNYEEKAEKRIAEEERPSFHLSSRTGWMNDPNGFSRYKGQYHMFYNWFVFVPSQFV